jgi:hypothetical protein
MERGIATLAASSGYCMDAPRPPFRTIRPCGCSLTSSDWTIASAISSDLTRRNWERTHVTLSAARETRHGGHVRSWRFMARLILAVESASDACGPT